MPGVDYNLVRAANISCDKAHTQPCFVHNMFFLSEQQYRACPCGAKSKPVPQDKNLFA